MKKHPATIRFEACDLEIAAAASGDETPPRFSMRAYTGGELRIAGFDLPVVVDLAAATFARNVVADLEHDAAASSLVGHITEKRITDGRSIDFVGLMSGGGPAVDQVLAAHRAGFPWESSIMARNLRLEVIASGRTVNVNHQTFKGPLYVARRAEIYRVAFCAQGADQNNTVAIAATDSTSEDRKMKVSETLAAFIRTLAPAIEVENLSEAEAAAWQRQLDASNRTAETPPADPFAIQRERSARAERFRQMAASAIDGLGDSAPVAMVDAAQSLAARASAEEWSDERFSLAIVTELRPTRFATGGGRRDDRIDGRVIAASICKTLGGLDLSKHFSEQTLDAVDERFPNGIGWSEILAAGAAWNGYQMDRRDRLIDLQNAAFGRPDGRREIRASGSGFSYASISGMLSNVAGKYLAEGWNDIEQTWKAIASVRSVRDFKAVTGYALTGALEYQKIGDTGEIKHGSLGETSYTNKADTYAQMVAVPRGDLVNDDLGALSQIPTRLGRGGALALNKVFWAAYLNDSAFFTAGNGNYISGATTTLTADGIKQALTAFYKMLDPDGQPTSLYPTVLLVPPELEGPALELYKSASYTGGSSKTLATNIYQGQFSVEMSRYLSNSLVAGGSATAWYLLTGPRSGRSVIEVCFLNGQEMPTIDTAEAAFNVLGIQMRGYHDFGVALQEYRGGVKSKGAA